MAANDADPGVELQIGLSSVVKKSSSDTLNDGDDMRRCVFVSK